ncbi:MAG TPA: glutathione S-transferase N-terminal domain-containing protein, partial [Nevskiaceae bacterium]|nr:glutathione S-transferase N-terminal domain-containing protein [Nevskiaceae bacterium]
MKLYYCPGTCATGTHIVLEWIGAPYMTHRVAIQAPKSSELVAINPSGAVPVLDVDGWVLTQNAAILNYLADAFPAAKLAGDGTPRARAEVNRWVGLINSDVHPQFGTLFSAT